MLLPHELNKMKILLEKGDTKEQRMMAAALLKNGIVNAINPVKEGPGNGKINDADIAQAIKSVMVYFSVGSQWVGIYRILVDEYGYPAEFAAFCKRIKVIMKGTACQYPCDYQFIQKGIGSRSILAKSYNEWCTCDIGENDMVFKRQKMIADKLIEMLR